MIRFTTRLVVAMAVVARVLAQADLATVAPSELTVQFSGGLISANYASVLVDLAKGGFVPLQAYVDDKGQTPEQILRSVGQLPTDTVAPELDRYLCEVNGHLCSLPKTGRGNWKNQKAPKGATFHGSCTEGNLPNFVVCVPQARAYSFLSVTTRKYTAGVDEPLKFIVLSQTEGCSKWDHACERRVEALNPHEGWNAKGYSGELLLPALRLALVLPVNSKDHLQRLTGALDRTIEKLVRTKQFTLTEPRVSYAVANNLKGSGGYVAGPPAVESIDDLSQMDYPYPTPADYNKVTWARVLVGIWDGRVLDHCDFWDAKKSEWALALEPDNLPVGADDENPPVQVKPCGASRVDPTFRSIPWDHGASVAGVIGARHNGFGIVGAHPRGRLWTYEFARSRGSREDPFSKVVGAAGMPDVVNVSLDDDHAAGVQTHLEFWISEYRKRVLFVVAAGNRNQTIKRGEACGFVPGCLSNTPALSKSVISVVALAADGKQPLDGAYATNRGTAFDVAAVGVTNTTLHGDSVGQMAGSSFAAPFVTSLAAMIRSKGSKYALTPAQIRERILYTADFSSTFDALVRFGRINFRRALDLDTDVTVLKPLINPQFDGRRMAQKPNETVKIVSALEDGEAVKPFPLELSQLRRLSWDASQNKYWVVYVDDREIPHKLDRVVFSGDSQIEYAGATREIVMLNTIQDYTCAIDCK